LNIIELIDSLGGLHDAVLLQVLWVPQTASLELQIEDLHANSLGFSDYRGPTEGSVKFSSVTKLAVDVEFSVEGLMIYELKTERQEDNSYLSKIAFSPHGSILIESQEVEIKGA
jgi:hypothetical protein